MEFIDAGIDDENYDNPDWRNKVEALHTHLGAGTVVFEHTYTDDNLALRQEGWLSMMLQRISEKKQVYIEFDTCDTQRWAAGDTDRE